MLKMIKLARTSLYTMAVKNFSRVAKNIPKLVGYWIKTPKALLAGYTIAKIALYILGFSILLTDTSKKVFTGQWSIIALAYVYTKTLSVSFLP